MYVFGPLSSKKNRFIFESRLIKSRYRSVLNDRVDWAYSAKMAIDDVITTIVVRVLFSQRSHGHSR